MLTTEFTHVGNLTYRSTEGWIISGIPATNGQVWYHVEDPDGKKIPFKFTLLARAKNWIRANLRRPDE